MNILVTANKGGVGCSSIAYLVGMLFPSRLMYSNDPWHIPDDTIIQLNSIDECAAINCADNQSCIFDIGMTRNKQLATELAPVVDVVLIPCGNDLQSVEAAITVYQELADKCAKRIIVINGFRSKKVRADILYHLASNRVQRENIVSLRDSRLMDRIFTYGPSWESSIRYGKGMHRLNRTLEIFESILADALS